MKKVLVASLLSAVAFTCVAPGANVAFAQAAAPAAAGQVQLSPAEYAAYTNATSAATPQAKATGLESFLTTYPQSQVKADVLGQLMLAYSGFDPAKTIDAADRLLQIDPVNLRALTFEVYFRKGQADQIADAAAKQAPLDAAAGFAQKGIAAAATPPKGVSDADFKAVKDNALPIFYSAIGTAALNKKDYAGAITAFTSELQAVPVAKTTEPGPILMDTFFLGQAYYASTPPDYVKCTFFTTRAAAYAPDAFKTQLQPTASYCYKKYHGNADGYDAVVTAAKANLFPPDGFTITPAPKASDIAHQTVVSTPDLATLAIDDKEFIIQNGSPEDAGKVWDTIKGKSVQIPGALVIESTPTVLKVAVSADAVQSKTADFTFNIKADDDTAKKTPAAVAAAKKKADDIAAATAVGQKVNLQGTYASFTANPFMITMSDSEVVLPKKAAAPVHHAPAKKH
jgi:hypothetical protein